jgi:hypothetical protein
MGHLMIVAEIRENASGLWIGQVRDPVTGSLEHTVFQAWNRGTLIAEMKYRLPLSHLVFEDRFCPTDP